MENPKQALRENLQGQRPRSSAGLTLQLQQLVKKLAPTTLASYQPLPAEPDVSEFNRWAADHYQLVFPRVIGDDLVFAQGPFTTGRYGIEEPAGNNVTAIDMVLVPALAVDLLGNRLGKGRGYYDRFLVGFTGPAYAVVFDEELLATIPVESHDRKVSGVITPNRTIVFD